METKSIREKLTSFCTISERVSKNILLLFFWLLTALLTAVSMLSTAYYDLDYNEHPLYKTDSPLLLIGIFIVLVLILFLYDKKFGLDKLNTRFLVIAMLVYTAVMSILWLYYTKSVPVADQGTVKDIAEQFYMKEYYSLDKANYLYIYPFQLGITAFLELGYAIFGRGSLLLLQICNVLSVCLIFYSLYRITDLTFHNKKTNNLVLLLMFGCFPPIMYCTFVYGNLIGLALSLTAVWLQLKYFESGKIRYIAISAFSIAFAIIIRSNSSIVLVAMVIMFILKYLGTRKALNLMLPVCIVAVVFSSSALLRVYYESRTGTKINEGAPKILWFAMGFQDSSMAPGWYNGFSLYPYTDNDCNAEIATEKAKEALKDSFKKFREDPDYTSDFFLNKFVSQWNDPTYQGFWISRVHPEGQELPDVITSFYKGSWHTASENFMNIYHFIIIFSAMCLLILEMRNLRTDQLFLALIIFGGFLFHMLWEAKGQYIMSYFVMFLPYSAAGIHSVFGFINEKLEKLKKAAPKENNEVLQ